MRTTDGSGFSRTDSHVFDDGTRVEASYFRAGGQSLFGVTHHPRHPTGHGVVICSPLFNDQLKNNRREVMLSRALAVRGIAVQRFHYAGVGHSDGSARDLTVASMIRDANASLAHFKDAVGPDRLTFVGTKLGALAAAALARQHGAPLAVWEPSDGSVYFRDLIRTAMIIGMKTGTNGVSTGALKKRFEDTGSLNVGGFSIGWPLFRDADGRTLVEEYGTGAQPTFVAQFSESGEIRPDIEQLVERWRSEGRDVTYYNVKEGESWQLFVYGHRPQEEEMHNVALAQANANWCEG